MVQGTPSCHIVLLVRGALRRQALRDSLHNLLCRVRVYECGAVGELQDMAASRHPMHLVLLCRDFSADPAVRQALEGFSVEIIELDLDKTPEEVELIASTNGTTPSSLPAAFEDLQPLLRKLPLLRCHWHDAPHPLRRQTDAIPITMGKKVLPVGIQEILSITSLGNSCLVESEKGKGTVSRSLKFFEKTLDPEQFIRVGKSHLLNLKKVAAFRPLANGCLETELRNGAKFLVSRRRASAFHRQFKAALGIRLPR